MLQNTFTISLITGQEPHDLRAGITPVSCPALSATDTVFLALFIMIFKIQQYETSRFRQKTIIFWGFFDRVQEIRHLDVLKQSQARPLPWRDHSRDEIWSVVCQVDNTGLQLKILRSVEKLNWMFTVFYCNSFHVALALLTGVDQFCLDGLIFLIGGGRQEEFHHQSNSWIYHSFRSCAKQTFIAMSGMYGLM